MLRGVCCLSLSGSSSPARECDLCYVGKDDVVASQREWLGYAVGGAADGKGSHIKRN